MKPNASRIILPLCLTIWLGGCLTTTPQEVKNTIGMEFVFIKEGSFIMGCGETDNECLSDEKPQHPVTLSKPFYLGKAPVTQEQWKAIMGSDPSTFKGAKRPVENVSWHEAQDFIRRLNGIEGTNKYRLPTEAEWEYAARAGMATKFPFDPDRAADHAWYWPNAGEHTRPVGGKTANPWGLHDMFGNVWEWVQDWYNERWYDAMLESYNKTPQDKKQKIALPNLQGATPTDPTGPAEGTTRTLRGGSWSNDLRYLRAAHRNAWAPDYKNSNTGFRLLVAPDSDWIKRMEAAQAKKKAEETAPPKKPKPENAPQAAAQSPQTKEHPAIQTWQSEAGSPLATSQSGAPLPDMGQP